MNIAVWRTLSDAKIVALDRNNTESDEDESEELTPITMTETKEAGRKTRRPKAINQDGDSSPQEPKRRRCCAMKLLVLFRVWKESSCRGLRGEAGFSTSLKTLIVYLSWTPIGWMWHTPSSGSEVSVRFYGRQISTLLDFYPMGQSQGPGVSRRCDYTNGFSCLSACCM
ncbi:hypothetical protein TNCV_876201 [Trichonephila clavipes]|nr:hypothetical protein TNCV_876201 [Trichonephila clavipes]